MSIQIERRLAALEQVTTADRIDTILWRVVAPGKLEAEVQTIDSDGGESWTRLPGEAEDQFIERAQREVTREENGCAWLIAKPVATGQRGAL